MPPPATAAGPLWAITCYFNPFRGQLRRRHYAHFRAHLAVPLLTVEWSPNGHFELTNADATRLVQVSGGDIVWQKDRLLNLALAALPADCEAVAALDCDVLFAEPDWAARTWRVLQDVPVAQPFANARYLAPLAGELPGAAAWAQLPIEGSLPSMAASLAAGHALFDPDRGGDALWAPGSARLSGNPGLAAAFRTVWLRRCGFYDGNAVGGADLVMTAAITGRLDELFATRRFSAAHQRHILAWAAQVPPLGAPGIGIVPGEVYHLWHGELRQRQYAERYAVLADRDYDPARHLQLSAQGVWCFSEAGAALRQPVREHLEGRLDA